MFRATPYVGILSLLALVLVSCAPALGSSATEPTSTLAQPTAVPTARLEEATATADPTTVPTATIERPTATTERPTTTAIPTEEPPTPAPLPAPTVTLLASESDLISIDPNEIITLLPPDAIPAIWDPQFLWSTVEEAEENNDIADEVSVMGVAIGDEAHAYPIPFLSAHEIVNDNVGGTAIAVTW